MKIKFLALAMIAMLFTACKPDPQPEGGEGSDPNKGEIENSYIAISIASADKNRNGDGFDEGSEAERAVESAYVFFFSDGAPFIGATNPNNYQEIGVDSLNFEPSTGGNVSDYSQKVLVIRNYKGELPNQMVAVLNWDPNPTEQETYTLEELQGKLVDYTNNTDYFIMSNSVYKNAAGDVYATPLAITDFQKSVGDAKANPVQVYVERVAAKVVVETKNVTDHKFALLKKGGGELKINNEQVYAKILGWELYNENTQSKLLKDIEGLPAYNDADTYGFYWNDANKHRSYWAANTVTPTDGINYDSITTYPEYLYCGENTSANNTKVILKAQLQNAAGSPIEVAKWYGNDYVGREQLVNAVRGTLVSKYYSRTIDENADTTYTSIQNEDLMIVNGTGSDAELYQVYFQLKTGATGYGEDKVWCVRSGSKFTQIGNADLNVAIKTATGTALLYPSGETYYFTDIKHFGDKKGVVRNHVYRINIKTISGYGTPVISDIVIPNPEIPVEDQETFVSAEINILSWKIVSYDVNL